MSGFRPNAYIHNALKQFERPSSLDDHEPTADERNGITRRLRPHEKVRFEVAPGVIIEVSGVRGGIEVRETGNAGVHDLVIIPQGSNQLIVEAKRR